MDIVNENIIVGVEFGFGKVNPKWFEWKGREYQVKRVPMIFERQDGGRKYLCFSVDANGMMVELVMDRQDLSWRIGKCGPSYT